MSKNLVQRSTVQPQPPPTDRVCFIVAALDKLEAVQNQYAAGCVIIGMELCALKKELGYGKFEKTFAEKIERPRFGNRTARRFMKVAEMLRVKLATGASVKLGEVLSMALAPSAMREEERLELSERVALACSGRTMQQLMLDFQDRPKALSAPVEAVSAEERKKKDFEFYHKHYTDGWTEILGHLAKLSSKHSWNYLRDDKIKEIRQCLNGVLTLMPKK